MGLLLSSNITPAIWTDYNDICFYSMPKYDLAFAARFLWVYLRLCVDNLLFIVNKITYGLITG